MQPKTILRVARPTNNLKRVAKMYVEGLGFEVLADFWDHAGFSGIILGHPHQTYHLEFTSQRGHVVGKAPTKDHLLVFYIPEAEAWEATCAAMLKAEFAPVPSYNPYWDGAGQTFEDCDGYRVVLQNRDWTL